MAEWGVPGMPVAARTRDACHANEGGTEHGCSSGASPAMLKGLAATWQCVQLGTS